MNAKQKISLLILTIFPIVILQSCDEHFEYAFASAQPTGVKNLKKIPKKARGKYYNRPWKTLTIITDFEIFYYESSGPIDSLKELSYEIIDENIVMDYDGNVYYYEIYDDSVAVYRKSIDLKNGNIARKFKGSYYISSQDEDREYDEFWDVKKYDIGKGFIVESRINEEDYEHLRKITGSNDSATVFNPTKKQFKQFVKEGGFRDIDTLFRVYDSTRIEDIPELKELLKLK